jgi:hypothetical protein
MKAAGPALPSALFPPCAQDATMRGFNSGVVKCLVQPVPVTAGTKS